MSDFTKELTALLNRHGKDAETNTADYVLADMLDRQIDVFANTIINRDDWPNTSIGTNICADHDVREEIVDTVALFITAEHRDQVIRELIEKALGSEADNYRAYDGYVAEWLKSQIKGE